MTPKKIVIECKNLDFAYTPDRPILKNIDLQIYDGELVALMGGSGSGKTTLLKLLNGLLKPQKGELYIDQTPMHNINTQKLYALRKRMGMLFQFGALFSDLNVFENIAFFLHEHTRLPDSAIQDLVLMKLNAVGLRGVAKLMPSEISGGMVKRVALARSMVHDPEFIFYDEPFAGLDPISMGVIAHLIRHLNQTLKMTGVIVSHDVHETLAIADKIYLLGEGHVVASGTPQDFLNSADPYVAQFIHARMDGPVSFHQPAPSLAQDFNMMEVSSCQK